MKESYGERQRLRKGKPRQKAQQVHRSQDQKEMSTWESLNEGRSEQGRRMR